MLNPRRLLVLVFGFLVCSAAAPANAQWCSHIVGMSVCDAAYPGVWASCVADDILFDCLSDGQVEADQCWAEYGLIWWMQYNHASRDCSLIKQECDLTGGFINSSGGCSRYLASNGGGGPYGGGGAGDGGGGSGGLECHTERLELQLLVGGVWITIWEGSGQVCEDAT